MKLPVHFGKQVCMLGEKIVDNEIPLLIGKSTMSSLGMKIAFSKHGVFMEDEKIKLKCNSAGHYYIPSK